MGTQPPLRLEFLKVVIPVATRMRRMRRIGRFAGGPAVRVPVRSRRDKVDVRSGRDHVLLSRDEERLGRAASGHAFRDCGHWGDQPELFRKDGTGEGAKQGREIAFIVPGGGGPGGEDLVEGRLEDALRRGAQGQIEHGEVNTVGGRLVPGKEEDKGISCDFCIGEGTGVR